MEELEIYKLVKTKKTQIVGGACEPERIANKFADFFESVCISNTPSKHNMFKNKFCEKFDSYCGKSFSQVLTVEMVDCCIRELKLGKAAGCDGLTAEHLFQSSCTCCFDYNIV